MIIFVINLFLLVADHDNIHLYLILNLFLFLFQEHIHILISIYSLDIYSFNTYVKLMLHTILSFSFLIGQFGQVNFRRETLFHFYCYISLFIVYWQWQDMSHFLA